MSVAIVGTVLDEIAKCEDDPRRTELLLNLKTAMGSFSRTDLATQMGQVNLEILFDCLSSDHLEQVETTCDILKSLMVVLDPVECLQKYHEAMLLGFRHPLPQVHSLVIAHLARCCENPDNCSALTDMYQDLLIQTINEHSSEDLSVAKSAGLLLLKLAESKTGTDFLLGPPGIDTFKKILLSPSTTDAVKFRAYETLSNIAGISERHLKGIEEHSLLIAPLSAAAFDDNDPLGQLNSLEILANLAGTKHGLETLKTANIFNKLHRLSQDWQNNPLSGLLFPGILKFIGNVGVVQVPQEELVNLVLEGVLSPGIELHVSVVAIEALCFIGTTGDGKNFLRTRVGIGKCFERIRVILEDSPAEFRCRVMDAISLLFGSEDVSADVLPRWFALIFPQIAFLFSLVQQPFPDLRMSALNFLSSVAHLEWAQKHYLRSPGVLEFLTERNVEPNKDCVLSKFNIVKIVAESKNAAKILPPEDMARLKMHVSQGPFYAPAQATVAIEGADQ